MVAGIICDSSISSIQVTVVSNSILLEHLHIKDGHLHVPHTGDCVKDHFVSPEAMTQQLPQVLLERERSCPPSLQIWHLLLYTIQGHQGGELIPIY